MIPNRPFRPQPATARDKLLEAAVRLVRAQGFSATSVDQLCLEAGVTKGAFFHHFPSKEQLGVAAAQYWSRSTGEFFASAPFHHEADPAVRVLGYIDLRIALISGPAESFSCVAGTMLQESFATSAAIRDACAASIGANARALEDDIAAALAARGLVEPRAVSLARHVQTVIQGAFVTAKALPPEAAAPAARESLGHLRRYVELLLSEEPSLAA
ncbi:TetR/AcrR family transcriptional regulator [Novosphingobium sp.]|uniref:TetR/AcrR family transcriptional regulator n=1 Tax=Novosphingobium sp. TaxID=1874826 RepID=UPI0025D594F3|nr:TetR/AcrR family transcriptional regulator [Novosphingobium sp.]